MDAVIHLAARAMSFKRRRPLALVPGGMPTPQRHLALLFGFFPLAFFLDRRLFVKAPALEFFEQTFFIDFAFQRPQRPIDLILVNGDL